MFTDEQFTRLAKAHMDTVFRVALNYLKSRTEADDITQNVLIKLYNTDKVFDGEAHVKHWLIRVTINECKKALMSPWKRTGDIDDYAATLSFVTPEHGETFYAVMELPKKYRVALFLHYYEEYSTKQISEILGVPGATIRTRLKRGREMLKKHLLEATDNGE